MSQTPITLAKQPALEPAQDFYRLRREGIGFIAQMASRGWTDYNVHDPGITILESLCYAITELAYRAGWDIKDILAPRTAAPDPAQPYPGQAFFTAREILTVNPATPEDFRRLLIDLDKIRNAWVFGKECACELGYYAWCDWSHQLVLSYRPPEDELLVAAKVAPIGLYEALLELEAVPGLGDLNDRKIEYQTLLHDSNGAHAVALELRFPDLAPTDPGPWAVFLASADALAKRNGQSCAVKLTGLGAAKGYDVFADQALDAAGRDAYVLKHWRNVFYLGLELQLSPAGQTVAFANASLRVFASSAAIFAGLFQAKGKGLAESLQAWLQQNAAAAFLRPYRDKAQAARDAVQLAKAALRSHRNLDEDYCTVKAVGIEEVAVCADIEVKPDADIEQVQAGIWFAIEHYFNPPVRFYSAQEALAGGAAVEDLFNGPELDNGFILDADLAAAALQPVLRVSDLINRVMDIDGVVAVNRLLLTKYDAEGNAVKGAADPDWDASGNPLFDANKASAAWLLYLSSGHLPRLYLNASRFLFLKNGLPFQPRMDEAADTLNQLRGEAERPKNAQADKDLRIPPGQFREPGEYYPVQYGFPLTYGIGLEGLPAQASAPRQAQAMQLKAYLMVFEQILGNALAQLAHTADLFKLDPAIRRTYFAKEFSEEKPGKDKDSEKPLEKAYVKGLAALSNGLTKAAVEALLETDAQADARRNLFLDHLLARFGEQFSEYALLLAKLDGRQVAENRLVADKIAFLSAYPQISHDRAKAFDYSKPAPVDYGGPPPRLELAWKCANTGNGRYRLDFQLFDALGQSWLDGNLRLAAAGEAEARLQAYRILIEQMALAANYPDPAKEASQFRLKFQAPLAAAQGQGPKLLKTLAAAWSRRDSLLAWSAGQRPSGQANQPGIQQRISLLLGHPDLEFFWVADRGAKTGGGYSYRLDFQLLDRHRQSWLDGQLTLAAASEAEAKRLGRRLAIQQLTLSDNYPAPAAEAGQFRLRVKAGVAGLQGRHPRLFASPAEALSMRDELLDWSANARLMVVEHLLLRPKFVGDALYPACSEGGCQTCGDEDPYSFRLTYVMPGWSERYANNLEMRRFVERTLQQETPSHLLGKACWVGNDGFLPEPCPAAACELALRLVASGAIKDQKLAAACAQAIYDQFNAVFKTGFASRALDLVRPAARDQQVAKLFEANPKPADIACASGLDAGLWAEARALMVAHFQQIARVGWQFERFEAAWFQWLDSNAPIDWAEERLHERVRALLKTNLKPSAAPAQETQLCQCAETLLVDFGMAFHQWMETNLQAGRALADFEAFVPPAITLCAGLDLQPVTGAKIAALLEERYAAYREVSYRLRIVVELLSQLRSVYPVATLHDCDDGSDQNPVRLDNTALGGSPLSGT